MENSQNKAAIADAGAQEKAVSGFFGEALLSETGAPEVKPPERPDGSGSPKRGGLSLAPSAAAAAPKPASPPPPPASAPPPAKAEVKVAAPSLPAPPAAAPPARPAAPPPLPAGLPPPVPKVAASPAPEAKPRRLAWKVALGIAAPLLAVTVKLSMPLIRSTLDHRWGGSAAAAAEGWPYLEVNGIQGGGEGVEKKAILSGEVVSIGSASANGVAVLNIEPGRVLLEYGGQERWILVGDRTL